MKYDWYCKTGYYTYYHIYYCCYYFTLLRVFFYTNVRWCFFFFGWGLGDSKLPQVFRILLRILADLNNAVIWMVSSHPLISKSSSSSTNTLVIVPRVAFKTGNTVSFMFHNFLQFPSKVVVLIFLLAFFQFYFVVYWDKKFFTIMQVLLFCWLSLSQVIWPRLGDPFVSQNPREVFASNSPWQILGCV